MVPNPMKYLKTTWQVVKALAAGSRIPSLEEFCEIISLSFRPPK